jgi:hypothetical protein
VGRPASRLPVEALQRAAWLGPWRRLGSKPGGSIPRHPLLAETSVAQGYATVVEKVVGACRHGSIRVQS